MFCLFVCVCVIYALFSDGLYVCTYLGCCVWCFAGVLHVFFNVMLSCLVLTCANVCCCVLWYYVFLLIPTFHVVRSFVLICVHMSAVAWRELCSRCCVHLYIPC